MANNRTGAFLGGLLVGTAVGTAVGLLLAPRSGRETRKFLRKSAEALPDVAEDVTHNMQYQTERLLDSAQKSLDETLVRLQEAIATGKQAMVEKRHELNRQRLAAESDPKIDLDDEESSSPADSSSASVSPQTETPR